MLFLRNHLFVAVAMAAVLFNACADDSSPSPIIEEPDPIAPSKVSTTAFTATLTAQYNGVSKVDIALGKSGILYCLKTDNAESIFKSWRDGNEDAECVVFNTGKASGEEYEGTIVGLEPETEYSYCYFMKNKDNTKCDLSDVSTFKTTPVQPRYSYFKSSRIKMFSANIRGTVKINESDNEYCKKGLLLSETENGSLSNNIRTFKYEYGSEAEDLEFGVNYLKPETDYWFRAYITYTTQDGEEHAVYSPETKFTTKPVTEEWGVNLNLPSGILWASCPLGRTEFDDPYDFIYVSPYTCYWGSTKRDAYSDLYEYYDTLSKTYTDIGYNIEGTQYDIAHAILGGKWRLPTKQDVEELIANCTIGKPVYTEYRHSSENVTSIYSTNIAVIAGSNGKYIKTWWGRTWTGTLSEDGMCAYYAYYDYDSEEDRAFIALDTLARNNILQIHPVWDPKMQ